MKPPAGEKAKLGDLFGGIQCNKDASKPWDQVWLDLAPVVMFKQPLQSFMAEAGDHLDSVACKGTLIKRANAEPYGIRIAKILRQVGSAPSGGCELVVLRIK